MPTNTWEQRMAHRAKLNAIKRQIRQNLEGPVEPVTGLQPVYTCGFECGVGMPSDFNDNDEWPEVIDAVNRTRLH